MNAYTETLSILSRPKLLIRAAKAGLSGYRRDVALKSLPGISADISGTALIDALFKLEAQLDSERRASNVEYQVQKHIAVLSALIAETAIIDPVLEYKMAA